MGSYLDHCPPTRGNRAFLVAKRSIYFPDELEKKMGNYPDENWSGVCQEAVGTRLRFLELKNDLSSSAIARAKVRLATDKASYVADAGERGERAGLAWAADKATFQQLRNLKEAQGEYSLEDGTAAPATVYLVMDNLPEYMPNDVPEEQLWKLCHEVGLDPNGPDVESAEFWSGFVDAAIKVFDEI
jgi:hypothetical protein